MIQYLWMMVWAFIAMLVTTALIGWGVRQCKKDFPLSDSEFFVGGSVLLVVGLVPAIILAFRYEMMMRLLFMFGVTWGILFTQLRTKGLLRELTFLALSFSVLPFVPVKTLIFPGVLGYLTYPILGVSIYLIMTIFTLLDRISWLSILTFLAQGLLFYLLRLFPSSVMEFLFYEFVIVMTIGQSLNIIVGRVVLGDFLAPVVGFFLGYAWTFVMVQGYLLAPVMGFSYHILELAIAIVATFMATNHFWPVSAPYLMDKAIENNPKKAIRYIFFVLVILGAFTFLYTRQGITYGFLMVFLVFLFSVYWMLKQWGTPRPSFRDLAKDIKDGLGALKKEITTIPLKEESVQKQPEVKKAAPVKKTARKTKNTGKKSTRK